MWRVTHNGTGQQVGEHKTKKAATSQADEMTAAYAAIDARHDGHPVKFTVEKTEEPEG